jgi:PAS domain S-box-containing protein
MQDDELRGTGLGVLPTPAPRIESNALAEDGAHGADRTTALTRSAPHVSDAEAEEDDAKALERLRQAQKLARVGTWEWDLHSGRNVWSDELWDLYGLRLGEQRASYAAWRETLHPDDRARCEERVVSSSIAGESFEIEWRTHPDLGPERWLLSRGHPLRNATGEVQRFVGIVMDVTERKCAEIALFIERSGLEQTVRAATRDLAEKERELRSTLDAIPGVVGYWDAEQINRYANQSYVAWFGLRPEDFQGRHLRDLLGSDIYALNKPYIDGALRGEPQLFERDIPSPGTNDVRTMQAHYVPDSVDGRVLGFYVFGFDVTERKRAEAAADAASQAKTDFLARMSHEIRTPLHAVLGLAQLGQTSANEERPREMFRRITDAGRHLLELLNAVLDFSKIEAGKIELQVARADLAMVETKTLSMVRASAASKGLALIIDEHPNAPAYFSADALRLEQVLINLLDNAVKFTDHGRVTLGVERVGECAVLSVSDTGAGMDAATLERVFRPFEQGPAAQNASGTGLGLAIASGLLARMHGHLEVASSLGGGTVMRAFLPISTWEDANFSVLSPLTAVGVPACDVRRLEGWCVARGIDFDSVPGFAEGPRESSVVLCTRDTLVGAKRKDVERWLEHSARFVVEGSGDAEADAFGTNIPDWLRERVSVVEWPLSPLRLLAAARAAPAQHCSRSPRSVVRLAGVRVLAAEDNAVNRLVLSEMLKVEGAQCVCVDDGELAMACVRQRGADAFDVVLCDIEMPGMDGYETARCMRAEAPTLPVIGLTAHAFDVARERSLQAGMVDFVSKPYMMDDLVDAIRRHVAPAGPLAGRSASATTA